MVRAKRDGRFIGRYPAGLSIRPFESRWVGASIGISPLYKALNNTEIPNGVLDNEYREAPKEAVD